MTADWTAHALQAIDPLFPVGGYAHSYALEGLVEAGAVSSPDTLEAYLQAEILPMLARFELPYARLAYLECKSDGGVASTLPEVPRILALDADIHAMRLTRELRDAAAAQGRRRLAMLAKLLPHPLLDALQGELAAGRFAAQHLTVFALHFALIGAPLEACLHAWLYTTLTGHLAASTKLIRIGEEGCQRILTACLARAPDVVAKSMAVAEADAGWWAPVLDVASARHEHATVRLFIS